MMSQFGLELLSPEKRSRDLERQRRLLGWRPSLLETKKDGKEEWLLRETKKASLVPPGDLSFRAWATLTGLACPQSLHCQSACNKQPR